MEKIERISDLLERGVSEIIQKPELQKLLTGKRKLRVKLGIDPTSPNLHIGRAVVLWKLRAFQELGHTVVFICGDFTGLIGDTSDKESERPMLSQQQVNSNLKHYFAQAAKIIDPAKAEMHYNSKWLKKLGFAEIGRLADLFGLGEFLSRELIKKRMATGKRVSLRELLYPLMQGFDSVAVKADIELGGTDQRFNLLAGRTIQPLYGQRPQNIMTMELLDGLDGRKMSSSWGNVINITDPPHEMFGKAMSLSDEQIEKYLLLAANLSHLAVTKIVQTTPHPRDQKLLLAENLVRLYHGQGAASQAKEEFVRQFSNKELPHKIPQKKLQAGSYKLSEIIVKTKLATSKTEARRLIAQGGVQLGGKKTTDNIAVDMRPGAQLLLQVGRRKFVYILA